MHTSRRRAGLTVWELLAIILVLGILTALLFPAIQGEYESTERTQCLMNLKQIGHALLGYHDAHNCFPPGNLSPSKEVNARYTSGLALILPYLDQLDTWQAYNIDVSPRHEANRTATRPTIRTFLCPKDPTGQRASFGPTNYFLSGGSGFSVGLADGGAFKSSPNGVFYQRSSIRLDDITDGRANTILAVESLIGTVRAVASSRTHYVAVNSPLPQTVWPKDGAEEWKEPSNRRADRGSSWADGRFLQSLILLNRAPGLEQPDIAYKDLIGGGSSARSRHPGMVNVLKADGSVTSVSDSIDLEVWKAVGTRGGGETSNVDL